MDIIIAIDGPVAAGKSTVAKLVAEKLGYRYVDTGAMYRCIAYFVHSKGLDCAKEEDVSSVLGNINIKLLKDKRVFLNDQDVSAEIRTPLISRLVSVVSVHKPVREFLVAKQREMAKEKGVVMEGRDIGSHVVPDAEIKIFQIASPESRAKRRYKELTDKGIACDFDALVQDIVERDERDSSRDHSPLKPVTDSIILDTSDITAEEAANKIVEFAKRKRNV